ncbi:MAG TPA: TlpA disulfide reductase family protein [Puia sp.]|nr:TlpA disulfide reductase family protein [Puia sp.]
MDSGLPFKLFIDQKFTPDQYEEKKRSWVKQYISHNRNSITGIAIYRGFFLNAEITDSEKIDVFNLLSNQTKSSYGGKLLSKEISVIKKATIGNLSPLFNLNDTNGRVFFLKEFRGKYVLIDFWASWCGPCRAQIPALKTVFEKYKSKKFEILAISLDTDRDRWINAINDEHFDWVQLSDLKGWTSPVMQSYHITAIPANLLIDPNGKIIAKNLEPAELDNKLFSIF